MNTYLLKNSGDINTQDEFGNTALIFATQSGDPDTVSFLLKNGADPNIKLTLVIRHLYMQPKATATKERE